MKKIKTEKPTTKNRWAGIEKLKEYAKSQKSLKSKVEWYKKRDWDKEAEIRLLKSRLQLAEKKIMYLEHKFQQKFNVKCTYQDLDMRIREIQGKRKIRRKQNEIQKT